MTYKITLGTANRPIQKVVTYNKKTESLHKEPHYPSKFTAETLTHKSLKQLGKLIENATEKQFLIHGHMEYDKKRVVPQAQLKEGLISRTKEYFQYTSGEPAVFMIDIDDDDRDPDEIHDILCELSPAFKGAEYLAVPSSTSDIYLKKKRLTQTKWHIYYVAENGSDIERFSDALFTKAILEEYGKAFITRAGSVLVRTFFDKSVLSAERIDFAGASDIVKPLRQDIPEAEHVPGEMVDTRRLKTLASQNLRNKYKRLLKEITTDPETIAEAERVTLEHRSIMKRDLMRKSKVQLTDEQAEQIIMQKLIPGDDGQFYLHGLDFVEFEDDESIVTVEHIRKDPSPYLDRPVRDPQEPDYGTGKALLRHNHGKIYITSQAHGGNRRFYISGKMYKNFDSENRRFYTGGMPIDQDFMVGGWQRLPENVMTMQTAKGLDVILKRPNSNVFRPIPEQGKQPHHRDNPYLILPFSTWKDSFPMSLTVLADYEFKDGEYKPVYKPLQAILKDLDWLEHTKTGGLIFEQPSEYIDKNYFNLYEGFAVEPKEGDCSMFYKLIELMEFENDDERDWLLDYFAQLVQEPFNKPGTGVIIQSRQGAGKNMLLELIGRLMPLHYYSTPVLDDLFKFNISLAGKFLINLDEATFGGDGKGGQHLKSIVTGHSITIERKFKDEDEVRNNLRFVITTNMDHPIPVELDDRRWAVYKMARLRKDRREMFFRKIAKWYNNGGAEALLHELLNRPVFSNLSDAPVSQAKSRIQEHSMSADLSFIKHILESGFIPTYDGFDEQELEVDENNRIMLHTAYISYKDFCKHEYGTEKFMKTKASFTNKIIDLFPGTEKRGRGRDREFLTTPPLEVMRKQWETNYGKIVVGEDEPKLKLVKKRKS